MVFMPYYIHVKEIMEKKQRDLPQIAVCILHTIVCSDGSREMRRVKVGVY